MSSVRDGQVSIEMNEISMEATSTKTEEEGKIDVGRTRLSVEIFFQIQMRRWEYVMVFDDVQKEDKEEKDSEREERMLKKGKFELYYQSTRESEYRYAIGKIWRLHFARFVFEPRR